MRNKKLMALLLGISLGLSGTAGVFTERTMAEENTAADICSETTAAEQPEAIDVTEQTSADTQQDVPSDALEVQAAEALAQERVQPQNTEETNSEEINAAGSDGPDAQEDSSSLTSSDNTQKNTASDYDTQDDASSGNNAQSSASSGDNTQSDISSKDNTQNDTSSDDNTQSDTSSDDNAQDGSSSDENTLTAEELQAAADRNFLGIISSAAKKNEDGTFTVTIKTASSIYTKIYLGAEEDPQNFRSQEIAAGTIEADGSCTFCFDLPYEPAGQIISYVPCTAGGEWYLEEDLYMRLPVFSEAAAQEDAASEASDASDSSEAAGTASEESGTSGGTDTPSDTASTSAGTAVTENEDLSTADNSTSGSSGSTASKSSRTSRNTGSTSSASSSSENGSSTESSSDSSTDEAASDSSSSTRKSKSSKSGSSSSSKSSRSSSGKNASSGKSASGATASNSSHTSGSSSEDTSDTAKSSSTDTKTSAEAVTVSDAPEIEGLTCEDVYQNESAALFRIYEYSGGYKLLEILLGNSGEDNDKSGSGKPARKESVSEETIPDDTAETAVLQYLLVPEGAEVPEDMDDNIIVIQLPASHVYAGEEEIRLSLEQYGINCEETIIPESSLYVSSYTSSGMPETADELLQSMKLFGIPVLVDRSADEASEEAAAEWETIYRLLIS